MFCHIGVSIDSDDQYSDAIIRALEISHGSGARISLWYAQPRPEDPLAQSHCELRADEVLTRTGAAAHAMGIPSRAGALFAEQPVREILNAAQRHGCDVIVTTRGPETHAIDLISLAHVPVLTVGPGCSPPPIAALELLRVEYRRLTGLLHQWLCLLSGWHAQGKPDLRPHRAGMKAVVEHIRGTVHPLQRCKEASLYGRLRRRFEIVRAEIDELLLLGRCEHELFAEVECRASEPLDHESTVAELSSALERYARHVWTMRGREEGVILPAARRQLTAAAWDRIHAELFNVLRARDGATGGA